MCTKISCALVGAQAVLERFETELGISAGQTTGGGDSTLWAVECTGGYGWGTVGAINHRYREHIHADDVHGIVAELRGTDSEPEAPAGETRD